MSGQTRHAKGRVYSELCYNKVINNLNIKSVARDWPYDLPATCFTKQGAKSSLQIAGKIWYAYAPFAPQSQGR